jgi:hypothetical protein
MKSETGIILVAGAIAALLLFGGKGPGEGGTGGSLNIPTLEALLSGSPASVAPVASVAESEPILSGDALRSFFEKSLMLDPGTYAATGKKTYSGQRTIDNTTYDIQGTLYPAETGIFSIDPSTGQGGYDLSQKVSLYTEGSKKATAPITKIADPIFENTMGGSSSNTGGTWTGTVFHQGKYT